MKIFVNVENNDKKWLFEIIWIWILLFSTTFSNISAISWRPVLVVEEAGENHRPWASNWQMLSHAAVSRVHPFCNLQSRARTHTLLVIGLYESLIQRPNSLSHPGPAWNHRNTWTKANLSSLSTCFSSFDLSQRDQMKQFYKWSNQIRQKLFEICNITAMI